jgi:trans-2,3-dihydro-3-hydroxyanthranilate isomerase
VSGHAYVTLDVFTDRLFGGNQLAVFPNGSAIREDIYQDIAREFNFSETVFVLPARSAAHARRLRIFTPNNELPFAGHPTVGTAHALAALGEIALTGDETRIVLEEGVGPIPVTIRARAGVPVFAQLSVAKLPEVVAPAPSREVLADVLSLAPDEILGAADAPEIISCGVPFLFVPVRDRDAVRRARVRIDAWERSLAGTTGEMMFVFARDPERPDSDIRARMFAPNISVRRIRRPAPPAPALAATWGCARCAATERTAGWWSRASRWAGRAFCTWRPTSARDASPPSAWAAHRWW